MIARNNKMKKTTLIAILLIAALSVGCTFTSASSNNISEPNGEAMAEIEDFSIKWADAYSERDANTIYELCENEELFFTIGDVAENGEYWMGMSSPWPWNKDYVIEIVDSSTIEIYYYFRTSTPSISVAKETITIEKVGDEYKAVKEVRKHFDTIDSKADFEEAYKHGLPDFTEFAAAYQFQADDDSLGRKEILEDPVAGAIEQLNLVGAKVTSIYQDPYVNKAVTKLAWDDGEVTINSIQPILTDEDGSNRQATIWIVVNEDDPEALLFNKERTTY